MLERGWLEESGYFNNSCKSRVVSFYGVARVPLFLTTFSTILITLLNIFFRTLSNVFDGTFYENVERVVDTKGS